MSSIVYFLISAVALAGAGVLLWLDHQRSTVARAGREVWGDAKGFHYRASDTKLRRVFRRATMDVPDHVEVRDVAFGDYDGAEAVVFDLTETATVIAVRRKAASQVIIDLRHEDVLAPAETDGLAVHRYEFDNLMAVNFVIVGLLGRGVAQNSRQDTQAKSLGEFVRSRIIHEATLGQEQS